jgi:hypothetical protein
MFTPTNCLCGTLKDSADILTSLRWTNTFIGDEELKNEHYYMVHEGTLLHDGRASDHWMGFNTQTTAAGKSTTMDLDLYDSSLGEDGKEDKVEALDVHQHGRDFNPFPTSKQRNETLWVKGGPVSSFKGLENSMYAPHRRGGGGQMCHMHVKATRC